MLILIITIIGILVSIYLTLNYKNEIGGLEKGLILLIGITFLLVALSYLNISDRLFLIYCSLLILIVLSILALEFKRKNKIPIIIALVWIISLLVQILNLPYWNMTLIIKAIVIIPLIFIILYRTKEYSYFTISWSILCLTNLLLDLLNLF